MVSKQQIAAAIRPATGPDAPVTQDIDRGLQLRVQALALLEQARALDGLRPFTVTHAHSFGSSTYMLWSTTAPTAAQAQVVLDCDFEPHRDETLTIEDNFSLEEITGVALAARLHDNMDSMNPSHQESNLPT